MVSVSKITNCRLGPDVSFELLGALSPGVMAEVVGVDTSRQYYYIRNPQNPQNFCWLWGYYATTVGDITSLPFFTPMPTPTLTIAPTLVSNFSVVLTNLDSCGANYYIQLKIHNIGSTVWSSGSIIAKDTVTSTVAAELSSNIFQERSGCSAVGDIQNDLAPGESGALHSSDFNYNPTGHELLITINLCTQDAMSGTCQTKQINFTP